MGYFPYDCEKCGGGDARCGQGHKKCEGGQFCWEDAMVFKVGRTKIQGVYDGYGRMGISGEDAQKTMFQGRRGITLNGRNEFELEDVRDKGKIYCLSCFEKKPKKMYCM